MTVSIIERAAAGLRWVVVAGPRLAAFRALGEHTREEIFGVVENMPERQALERFAATSRGQSVLGRLAAETARTQPVEYAELAALAAGAGIDFDTILLANLRGDLGGDGTGCSDLGWRRAVLGRAQRGRGTRVARTVHAAHSRHRRRGPGDFTYTFGEAASGRVATVEAAAGRVSVVQAHPVTAPLIWHTNHLRYLDGEPGYPQERNLAEEIDPSMVNEAARSLGLLDESTARGRLLDALAIPAAEPSPDWFLDILTSAAPPWGLPQRGAGRPPDDTVLRGNRPDGW